jgi:nucleotide-binding universal stress UspA family protein
MAKGYAPELEDQKKPAFTLLERIGNELRKAGFNVQAAAKIGDVRETIIETAVKWHADIILVGSHGRRGIQSFLWGAWRNLSLAMQNAP